jgi:hypothetical protein
MLSMKTNGILTGKFVLLLGIACAALSFAQPVKAERSVQAGPTHVESVPDGGWTMSLLGFALLGLAALRRKLSR